MTYLNELFAETLIVSIQRRLKLTEYTVSDECIDGPEAMDYSGAQEIYGVKVDANIYGEGTGEIIVNPIDPSIDLQSIAGEYAFCVCVRTSDTGEDGEGDTLRYGVFFKAPPIR